MKRKNTAGLLIGAAFALPIVSYAVTPPYDHSTFIDDISVDLPSLNVGASTSVVSDGDIAKGSDIWVTTWADDGYLYSSWGDGIGFGALDFNEQNTGKALMGVSRISGTPAGWSGVNINGGKGATNTGDMAHGKPRGIISIGGVLYVGIDEEDSFNRGKMCKSTDHGLTWTTTGGGACLLSNPTLEASNHWDWTVSAKWNGNTDPCPTDMDNHGPRCGFWSPTSPLQQGQDYREARDGYVYWYNDDVDFIVMARVLTDQLMERSQWQFLSGYDSAGNPKWSYNVDDRAPTFQDTTNHIGWGTAAMYNPVLHRYLLTTRPYTNEDDGSVLDDGSAWGLFDAPEPWGPWTTVRYFNELRDITWKFSFNLNQKWMSSDGLSMGLIFSGVSQGVCFGTPVNTDPCYDSINVVDTTMTLPEVTARISSPMAGTVLVPGQVVTATAVTATSGGTGLSWSVKRDSQPPFQTGTGSSITFTVPSGLTAANVIHLTVTQGSVTDKKDFAVATGTSAGEAYWKLDDSSLDSSGGGSTLTLDGDAAFVTAKIGKGLSLGSTGSANAGVRAGLAHADQTGLTLSAWVKTHSSGGGGAGRIIDKNNDESAGWFLKTNPDSSLQFVAVMFATTPLTRSSVPVVSFDSWHHVAVTWDGSRNASQAHIYVDGALADDNSTGLADGVGSVVDDSAVPLSLGNRVVDHARIHDGSIDEVKIYKRVLSTAEIQALANPQTPARAYWAMDENAGSSAADSSNNSAPLTLSGGATWETSGQFSHALRFNGGTAIATVSGTAASRRELSHLNRNGMTVSAWVKPTSTAGGSGRIVDKDNDTAGWYIKLNGDGTVLFAADYYTVSAPSRNSLTSLVLNTWQHVAVTWDGDYLGSNAHIYINGALQDGATTNGSGDLKDDTDTPLSIGNRSIDSARGFNGAVDNVKIFNRPLSPTEISALVSAP